MNDVDNVGLFVDGVDSGLAAIGNLWRKIRHLMY